MAEIQKRERFGRYLILDHLVDGGMAKMGLDDFCDLLTAFIGGAAGGQRGKWCQTVAAARDHEFSTFRVGKTGSHILYCSLYRKER